MNQGITYGVSVSLRTAVQGYKVVRYEHVGCLNDSHIIPRAIGQPGFFLHRGQRTAGGGRFHLSYRKQTYIAPVRVVYSHCNAILLVLLIYITIGYIEVGIWDKADAKH